MSDMLLYLKTWVITGHYSYQNWNRFASVPKRSKPRTLLKKDAWPGFIWVPPTVELAHAPKVFALLAFSVLTAASGIMGHQPGEGVYSNTAWKLLFRASVFYNIISKDAEMAAFGS